MYINHDLFVEMQKQNEKSLNAFNKMVDLVDSTLSTSNIPSDEFSIVTGFLLSKFYKTLLSIRILAVSGLEEDSRSLLRILFEQLLNLLYISQDPSSRTRLFIEYNSIERMNFLNNIQKHYPSAYDNIDVVLKNSIYSDFQKVENKYIKYKGWSGKSVRKIAEEIGNEALYWYDILYSAESIHVHGTVNSSKNILFEENEIMNIKVGPYPFNASDLFSKATELARDMLNQSLTNWNLNKISVSDVWLECKCLLETEFVEKRS